MANSALRDLLIQLDIKRFTDEDLRISIITNEIKEEFEQKGWDSNHVTRHTVEEFIKKELSLIINPDKQERKNTYWIKYENHKKNKGFNANQLRLDLGPENNENSNPNNKIISQNPQDSFKEINLLKKIPTDIKESNPIKNTIDLDSINNDLKTILKNIDQLKSEIKRIKRLSGISDSTKNKEYIEQMIKILGSNYASESIIINSSLLESFKELMSEEYGIKKDISKIINAALVLALYKK